MGREIRRVPSDWFHPRDERGALRPMYDADYNSVAAQWMADCLLWELGQHPDQAESESARKQRYYWDWHGNPPDRRYYRPTWDTEPTHYQIYETVSEGTPVSPVFASLAELEDWLVTQGYNRAAATAFARDGWVPSMVLTPSGILSGIEAAAVLATPTGDES